MSGQVREIHPKPIETYVCPCGSQWFAVQYQFDTRGHIISRQSYAYCTDCRRKHHFTTPETGEVRPIR